MSNDRNLKEVTRLMMDFADRTGLRPQSSSPARYLWTDAFAVMNFLELYRLTRKPEFKTLALDLVEQVHSVLGQYRPDDDRMGWISGLDPEEGRRHPTIGGLRIGKKIRERGPGEDWNPNAEWDRDGQYYHYLVKWIQALTAVFTATGEDCYRIWAVELCRTAHRGFVSERQDGGKFMYWKMSTDLSRSLVPSMGQHDLLDGLIIYQLIQDRLKSSHDSDIDLSREITDMVEMSREQNWITNDPLGLGGLLSNAVLIAQIAVHTPTVPRHLLNLILDAALIGMQSFTDSDDLRLPSKYRLPFRECGLSLGLKAIPYLKNIMESHPKVFKKKKWTEHLEPLATFTPLIAEIESFWLEAKNRESATWLDNLDINAVMLATSLLPEAYFYT